MFLNILDYFRYYVFSFCINKILYSNILRYLCRYVVVPHLLQSVSPLQYMAEEEAVSQNQESYLASLSLLQVTHEIFTSPLNIFLLGVFAVLMSSSFQFLP